MRGAHDLTDLKHEDECERDRKGEGDRPQRHRNRKRSGDRHQTQHEDAERSQIDDRNQHPVHQPLQAEGHEERGALHGATPAGSQPVKVFGWFANVT